MTEERQRKTGRRTFIGTAAVVALMGLAGCSDGEDPAFQASDTVTVEPGEYHAVDFEIPRRNAEPGYAISWEVRCSGDTSKFGVYIFEAGSASEYETYQEYVDGRTNETPSAETVPSKARIKNHHRYEKRRLEVGDYAFIIDNTKYRGWAGLQGYPPSDTELEITYDIQIPINLPDVLRDAG